MSPDNIFFVKLFITFLLAGLVTFAMEVLQRRKQDKADRQFNLTLKANGLVDTVIERKGESNDSKIEKR